MKQREYYRLRIELSFTFKVLRSAADPDPKDGETLDLSGGGMRFRTDSRVAPGDRVKVRLSLDGEETVQGNLRVLRVERKQNEGFVAAGQFEALSPRDEAAIVRYVMQKETRRPKVAG